jgi:hypothetical protein
MEELMNENLVAEQVAENVEVTTEETPKTYTEAEFNAKLDEVLGKKIARKEAKIRKEYEKKYGDLENVLRAGTGKDTVEEFTSTFKDFYTSKGIQIAEKPKYSDRDIEVLARAEAEDIIRYGYDEVVEEVDRLAKIGAANMTAREKAVFKVLAEHRQSAERKNELSKMGVTEDVYTSKEFSDFASKFNPNVSVSEIYEIYNQRQPKKNIKPMGSMKNNDSGDNGVKDFYTVEEARKFTKKDYDQNPALYAAVEKSMQKWK